MEEVKAEGAGGELCGETVPVQAKREPPEDCSSDSHSSDVHPHDLVVAELGYAKQSTQPEAVKAMGMPEFAAVRVKQEPVDMEDAAGLQEEAAGLQEEAAGLQDAVGTKTGGVEATKAPGMPEFAVRVKQEPVNLYTQMEDAIHRGLEAASSQDGVDSQDTAGSQGGVDSQDTAGLQDGVDAGDSAGSRGDVVQDTAGLQGRVDSQDTAGSQGAGMKWEAVFVKQEPVDEDDINQSTVPGQSPSELVFSENICIKVEVEFEVGSEKAGSGASETAQPARGKAPGTRGSAKRPPAPPRPPQPSECEICHRKVTSLSKLKEHMRIHTGEKPYRCETCNKGFTQMSHLKKHVRIHTGEKPYTCEMCKKDFTLLDSLKIHQRIHTGEKPYSCNTCDKKFGDLSTLKRHGRIHTREKPYTCNVCQKAFAQLGSLKVHERTHTGEKPYECEVCNKKFSESGTLKRHERIHTGEKPYSCEICERAFTELGCLNKHRRTHNREISSVSLEWGSESNSGNDGMAMEVTEDAELKTS